MRPRFVVLVCHGWPISTQGRTAGDRPVGLSATVYDRAYGVDVVTFASEDRNKRAASPRYVTNAGYGPVCPRCGEVKSKQASLCGSCASKVGSWRHIGPAGALRAAEQRCAELNAEYEPIPT